VKRIVTNRLNGPEIIQWNKLNLIPTKVDQQTVLDLGATVDAGETEDARIQRRVRMEMTRGREMIQWNKIDLITTKVEQPTVLGVGETEDARIQQLRMAMIRGREMIQWSKLDLISSKVEQQEVPGVGETEDAPQDDRIQRVLMEMDCQTLYLVLRTEEDGTLGVWDRHHTLGGECLMAELIREDQGDLESMAPEGFVCVRSK
jgi:hypothetical protein